MTHRKSANSGIEKDQEGRINRGITHEEITRNFVNDLKESWSKERGE
jgi:hypothetical protein